MANPKFAVDAVVYLETSARLGHLESYAVSSIHQVTAGRWAYKIQFSARNPSVGTFGDAITGQQSLGLTALFFQEAELLTYCEASEIAIDSLQRRLTALQTQRDGKC